MQHLVVQVLCLCMLVVDGGPAHGRLLIGMGEKLKPVELCSYTLALKRGNELMWSMVQNNSKARWDPAVFLIYFLPA